MSFAEYNKKRKNITKKKNDWRHTWQNILYMLGLIKKSCSGVLVLSFASTILSAVNSFLFSTYLFQFAINALQEGKPIKRIILTLGAMLTYSLLYMIFSHYVGYYRELHIPKVEAYIQKLLQKKAMEVELACYDNSDFYDTYVKASGEASERALKVLNNMTELLWAIVYVCSAGTIVVTLDPIFLLLAFLPLACNLLVGKHRNRLQYKYKIAKKEVERQKDYVRRTFYLTDFSKEMRLTEMWRVMFRRMHDSVAELKALVKQYGYKLMFFSYLFRFIFDVVVYNGSIILAAYRTLVRKNMLLGDCFVIISSVTNIAADINYIGDVFMKLDEDSLFVDNLRAFLEYEIKIPEDKHAPEAPGLQTLTFSDVSFTYEGQGEAVLNRVNLTVHAGERIAVVGHNGAGKTTLVKLLLRLYDPTEGEILINGEDIRKYRLSSYRALFGTVFQDYHLFATSVEENVMLRGHLTEADREAVRDALVKSGIEKKVSGLPHGMKTTVTKEFDQEGIVFSGGEAQKISIARVFVGNHEILILDEPTSALDPIAEYEMYQNMFEACKGKTVIFISHRLSSATMADKIYLFEKGVIKEQGTHGELLSLGGIYADMWHKQADTYVSDHAFGMEE